MTPEFEALWQDFIDGTLDAAGFAEFERMLRADPGLCARAAELYAEHRLLGLALRPEQEGRFVAAAVERLAQAGRKFSDQVRLRLGIASAPKRPSSPRWLTYAVAACLMLMVGVLWRLSVAGPVTTVETAATTASEHLATVVRADHCAWEGGRSMAAGHRLAAGTVHLLSGQALVRFDGGATALLTGPVDFSVDSAGGATLIRGSVTIRVTERAAGFTLRTPASDVVDLGTEFSVSVERDGATAIQVLEGEVELHARQQQPGTAPHSLRAGQALRLRSADDRDGQPIPFTAERIDVILGKVAAGPDAGRLTAYESFTYRMSRTYSNQRQADGGFGWKGPWFRNSYQSDLEILFGVDASLEAPAGLVAPAGGRLVLPPEPERPDTYRHACMRRFATPIEPDVDGVTYFSALVSRSTQPAGPTHHWLHVMLVSEKSPRDRMGFAVLSDFHPQVMGPQGNANATSSIVAGRPYLFVIKFVTGRDAAEQMFLKVYDRDQAVDAVEPENWTVVGRPYRMKARIDAIHVYNGTECGYDVDEIRFGTSWLSVTPRQ